MGFLLPFALDNFFFVSAGAGAAYLTAGESFPLEVRARTISIFYAPGTAIGGISGPGTLIARGARGDILWGYVPGGMLMLAATLAEAAIGVAAERRPLEDVARPLPGGAGHGRVKLL